MNDPVTCKSMKKKGSLAITLMVVFMMATLSSAFLLRGVNESALSFRVSQSSAALWAAEAGLQQVLWEYNHNNCAGMTREGGNTGCNGNKTLAGTLAGYGDYDVTLDSTNTGIRSVGSIPGRTAVGKVQRRIQAVLGRPAIFGHGMFAQGLLRLRQNSLVDAYNSSLGPYGGVNIDHLHGDVGTNGTTAGIVQIDQNATVWGDVSTGPGGTAVVNGTVHGSITNNNSIALPAVVVPSSLTSLPNSGTMTVGNNDSRMIGTGNWKFSSMDLGNKSTLTISGDARIYLTGNAAHEAIDTGAGQVVFNIAAGGRLVIYTDGTIDFNNNITINNIDKKPENFQIYSTYTGANGVIMSNNSSTYAAIYAPQTDVNVSNNAGLFGAIVGKTATLDNNGDIHYDTALASMANPFEDPILTSWQEY